MTPEEESRIDWSLTSWKGSRRQQHREFLALPFRTKLEIVEKLNEAAFEMLAWRKSRGLPYIDPASGKLEQL